MCAEYTISGRHGKDVLAEQKQASHQALTLFTAYEAHRQYLLPPSLCSDPQPRLNY